MRLKRILVLFLAIVLVLSTAAGGKTSEPASSNQPASSGSSSSQPASSGSSGSSASSGSSGQAATTEPGKTEQVEAPPVNYGGILRVQIPSSPTVLCNLYKTVGHGYISACVETLGLRDVVTNEVTPLLAESWEYDEATYTITVHLRKGVKFHDGSELNAEVVKWNHDVAKEHNMIATYHNFDTEIVDDYTVKIIFDQFYLDWERSGLAQVYMYSKKAFDEKGEDYLLSHPVGTGAFSFVEYVPDQKLTYTKFDDYWGTDEYGRKLPYLDGVEIHCILDSNAAMTAFVTGEIDTLTATDNNVVEQLELNGFKNKCDPIPASTTIFEVFANTLIKDSPWADINVRKAVFLYGIDYEDLTKLAGGPTAVCEHNINIAGSLLADPSLNDEYHYDLEKAKKMLADAGYPDGFETGLETTGIGVSCATVLQEKLKALNIKAEITQVTGGDARRYDPTIEGIAIFCVTTNWDTIIMPLGSMHSPLDLAGGATQGPVVRVDFSQEYHDLFEKAMNAKTYDERIEWGKKATRQLYINDVNSTLCYTRANAQFISDKVHNTLCEYNWPSPIYAWKEP